MTNAYIKLCEKARMTLDNPKAQQAGYAPWACQSMHPGLARPYPASCGRRRQTHEQGMPDLPDRYGERHAQG